MCPLSPPAALAGVSVSLPGGPAVPLAWPADRLAALEQALRRVDPAGRVAPGELPAAGPGEGAVRVGTADLALAGYAEAYARSTGAVFVGDGACDVRVADLVRTRRALLDGPDAAAGILHVDEAGAGAAHLLKNLLALRGALPLPAGTLLVAPELRPPARLAEGDETLLLGRVDGAAVEAALRAPRRHLLASGDGLDPFDAVLGAVAVCALDGGAPAHPGERALPCFSGGGCTRMRSGGVERRVPPAAIAAAHVAWFSCHQVPYAGAVHRSYRSLVLQMLGGAHTVSLLASTGMTTGGPAELLHACFLLDRERSLGEFRREMDAFTLAGGGRAAGRVLLGDPRLRVGGGGSGGREEEGAPGAEGCALAAGPPRRLVRLPAPAALAPGERVRVRTAAPGAVAGSARPLPEGGVEVELLAPAATGGGAALRVVPRAAGLPARLERLRRRVHFWRAFLLRTRSRVRGGGTGAAMADACVGLLDALSGVEELLDEAIVRVHYATERRVDWDGETVPLLRAVRRTVAGVQPALLELVTRFAASDDPRVHMTWLRVYLESPAPTRGRCACGRGCSGSTLEIPGTGMRRSILRCPRCGVVADHEAGAPRRSLRVEAAGPDGALRVRLRGVRQRGPVPLLAGAALSPDGTRDGTVRVESSLLTDTPGELALALRPDPALARGTARLHVYTLCELEWAELSTFVHRPPAEP